MANDLQLKVVLDAVNKASAPLRQINQGSQETARALKETRDRLKELNAQQKDVSAWRQQHAQARETAQALDAARAKVKEMGRAMSAADAPTKQMTAEFQAAIRATNALKQQHKDEQDALRGLQRRLDLVAAGMQKVSTQMRGEIPEILHEYSTHFRGMGFSGEEAMSLLVNMAKQGKFALDKTGDAIKEFSIRGSDMSKASKEAYASIGLNAEKMSSAIAKGGGDARKALTSTANALLRIKDPAERANAAIALFGTPVEDLAVDQIPEFLKALAGGTASLGDIGGAADKMGKTFRDNLGGDLDKLTGTWGALMGSLMDGQNGPLRELVQTVTEVVGTAKTWIDANPELASGIAKGAAAIAVLVAGMGALTVAMASVLGPFALAQYGMAMFAVKGGTMLPVIGRLVSVLSGGLMSAIRLVSAAMWTLAANPVVLAIAAIVAVLAGAAYLIYRNWDQVKAYFSSAWAEIKAGFSGGITGILTVLANFSPIGLIYQAFSAVMNYLGVEMPGRFTEFGGMIISGLVNGLMSGLSLVKDTVSALGDSTIGWFKEKLGIHSPSRVFAELGGFTTEGLAMGLDAGAKAPLDAVARMGQDLTQAGQFKLNAAAPEVGAGQGIAVEAASGVTLDNRPPIAAAAGSNSDSHDVYNINIQPAPGMDPQAIARAVSAELDRRSREKSARQRSSLSDQE